MAGICIISRFARDYTQYKIVPDVMVGVSKIIKGADLQGIMEEAIGIQSTRGPALNLQNLSAC